MQMGTEVTQIWSSVLVRSSLLPVYLGTWRIVFRDSSKNLQCWPLLFWYALYYNFTSSITLEWRLPNTFLIFLTSQCLLLLVDLAVDFWKIFEFTFIGLRSLSDLGLINSHCLASFSIFSSTKVNIRTYIFCPAFVLSKRVVARPPSYKLLEQNSKSLSF